MTPDSAQEIVTEVTFAEALPVLEPAVQLSPSGCEATVTS